MCFAVRLRVHIQKHCLESSYWILFSPLPRLLNITTIETDHFKKGALALAATNRKGVGVNARKGVLLMLQKTVSYKSLLRVLGGCFLLYGLYLAVIALTAQIEVSGSIQYTGPVIFEAPETVRNYLLCGGLFLGNPVLPVVLGGMNTFGPLTPGPLLWVGIGILWLSVTSRHINVMYVCLQIALWLISLSVWFPIFFLFGSPNYDPASFVPFWLVTLLLSLVLLTCYKPVTHVLRKLYEPNRAALIPEV